MKDNNTIAKDFGKPYEGELTQQMVANMVKGAEVASMFTMLTFHPMHHHVPEVNNGNK